MMTAAQSETIVLLDPTLSSTRMESLAPRLSSLDNARIGVIWNGRSPGDLILDGAITILRERWNLSEVAVHTKPHVGNVAPDDILTIMSDFDAVLAGVGDCGSCCPASVLDAISMERRGVPAVAIGAERLVETVGRGMAKIQGAPDFPIAMVHGVGQLEGIRGEGDAKLFNSYARDVADQVEQILTGSHETGGSGGD